MLASARRCCPMLYFSIFRSKSTSALSNARLKKTIDRGRRIDTTKPLSRKTIDRVCQKYEEIRKFFVGDFSTATRPEGYAVMVRNGMLAWMRVMVDQFDLQISDSMSCNNSQKDLASKIESIITNIILERLEL